MKEVVFSFISTLNDALFGSKKLSDILISDVVLIVELKSKLLDMLREIRVAEA